MTQHLWLWSSLGALCIFAQPSVAQSPTALRPPTATLSEEFSQVQAIRELADGRVLIGDRREARIVLADFALDRTTPVSRHGLGPGEFSNVYPLYALGADSSLMVDPVARRWHLFDGAVLARLVPPDAPAYRATDGLAYGADTRGFLLAQRTTRFDGPRKASADLDSVLILRVTRASGLVDTIAKTRPQPTQVETEGQPGEAPKSITLRFTMLGVAEEAVLAADGWLAIARLDPYRVDWRSPDGAWTLGSPLPFTAVKVTELEKRIQLARRANSGRRIGRPPDPSELKWVESIPPFQSGALLVLPDGNLLIARTRTVEAPQSRYDVVDRRGRLVRSLELPASVRIAGAGRKDLYVVTANDDGFEHVRRHPWP